MIDWGRLRYPIASENLRHWRDGRGKDRVLPATAFASEGFFLDHLRNVHRAKFIAGAERRLKAREIAVGGAFAMEWTDSVYAPFLTDLYYALGGFTVHSQVRAAVVPRGNGVGVRFVEWKVEILDQYDWDPGKSRLIPGVGRVTDDEMLALERAGYGKAYRVRSEWATITEPSITVEAALAP
jgi:hypothetical protein